MMDDTAKRLADLEGRLDAIAPKPERSREEILADLDRQERAILARQHWAKLVSEANWADVERFKAENRAAFDRANERVRAAMEQWRQKQKTGHASS
jgi:hypothetical protein